MKKTLATVLTAVTLVSMVTVPVSKRVYAEDKKTTAATKKDDLKGVDALLSFKVTIEGSELVFPMQYADLEKMGWKIADDYQGEVVPSAKYVYGIKAVKGDKEIELSLMNDKSDANIPVTEATVVGVNINQSSYVISDPAKVVDFKIPGGATGLSTREEVSKLYGEPKSKYSGSDRTTMTYEVEYTQRVEFAFDDKANKMSGFKMENVPTEPEVKAMIKENMAKAKDTKKDDKSSNASSSKADSKTEKIEMGKELTDYTIEIDGVVFKVPTDFKALQAAGWDIHKDEKGSKVPSKKYTMGTKLTKGELEIEGNFLNTTDKLLPLEDAKIVKLSIQNYRAISNPASLVNIKLPKGITEKSTYEEAVKAYGEPKSKNTSGDVIYATWEEDYNKGLQLVFNTKTKMIESIELEFMSAE